MSLEKILGRDASRKDHCWKQQLIVAFKQLFQAEPMADKTHPPSAPPTVIPSMRLEQVRLFLGYEESGKWCYITY